MSKGLKYNEHTFTLKKFHSAALMHVEKPDQFHNDPQPGKPCPKCYAGVLDYDGLLNLICTICGYTLTGCST